MGGNGTAGAREARTTWRVDPATALVKFEIRKRLLFLIPLTVAGRFGDIAGTIVVDERDPTTAEAAITIDATTIDTGSVRRDTHLRSADFFDVERYPALMFRSRSVEAVDRAAGRYRVVGELTVRDVTREVTLDATYTVARPGGRERRVALTLTAPLRRRDFGLDWNRPHLAVADDLTVTSAVEATPA